MLIRYLHNSDRVRVRVRVRVNLYICIHGTSKMKRLPNYTSIIQFILY